MKVWKCQSCGWSQDTYVPQPPYDPYGSDWWAFKCPLCGDSVDFDAGALPYGDEDE